MIERRDISFQQGERSILHDPKRLLPPHFPQPEFHHPVAFSAGGNAIAEQQIAVSFPLQYKGEEFVLLHEIRHDFREEERFKHQRHVEFVGNAQSEFRLESGRINFEHEDVQELLAFTDTGLDRLRVHPTKEGVTLTEDSEIIVPVYTGNSEGGHEYPVMALPNETVIPVKAREKTQWGWTQFGWDMHPIVDALLEKNDPESRALAKGIAGNLVYEVNVFGYMPNGSKLILAGRGHPTVLLPIVKRIWDTADQDDPAEQEWFAKKLAVIEQKEWKYLTNERHTHKVTGGFRFASEDVDGDDYTAQADAGEDCSIAGNSLANMASPMGGAMLYEYAKLFAESAKELYDHTNILDQEKRTELKMKQLYWEQMAEQKKATLDPLWNEETGLFHALDDRTGEHQVYKKLSSYMMMTNGIATEEQARRMVENLPKFVEKFGVMDSTFDGIPTPEQRHALVNDLKVKLADMGLPIEHALKFEKDITPKQWDAPHGFANLEEYLVRGLIRYGYVEDAVAIMENTMCNLTRYYKKHGNLPEKLDMQTGERSMVSEYDDQSIGISFGWTIAQVELYKSRLQEYYQTGKVIMFPGTERRKREARRWEYVRVVPDKGEMVA